MQIIRNVECPMTLFPESFNPGRSNSSDHIIVTFYMRVNKTSVAGTSTYIGAGIQMGTTMIWSGAKFLTVTAAPALPNLVRISKIKKVDLL